MSFYSNDDTDELNLMDDDSAITTSSSEESSSSSSGSDELLRHFLGIDTDLLLPDSDSSSDEELQSMIEDMGINPNKLLDPIAIFDESVIFLLEDNQPVRVRTPCGPTRK